MDGDNFDEDADDDFFKDFETTREGVIFCVDTSKEMFQGFDEDGQCYLQRCFKCIRDRMLHNIMVSDKEFVGIMMMGARAKIINGGAGTSGTAAHNGIDGLAALLEVERPGAEILKKLNVYIKSGDFKADFAKDYETEIECALPEALWDCQSRLSVCNTKFGPKEVFFMTCNDMSDADVTLRRHACKRAEALMQVGISLRLLFLGDNFNINGFFKELLLAAHPMIRDFDSEAEKFAATNMDRVPGAALTRSSFNRHQFRLDWNIADGVSLTVLLYSNFRSKNIYEARKNVLLDQRSNVRVTGKVTYFDNETGGAVAYNKLLKGIQVGDRSAIFTTAEQAQMRNLYPAGLTLLGFKPLSKLILEDFIKPGVLIQADDMSRKGSSTLFHALLNRCLQREVVPVCRMVLRAGTSARLVYLLPQEQGEDKLGTMGVAGFQAVYVPFNGEIRPCAAEIEEMEATPEQQQIASKIIRKLVIGNFSIDDYKNPAQRTFFFGVEALALDYEAAESVVDPVVPDEETIDERIEALVPAFLASVSQTASTVSGTSDQDSSVVSAAKEKSARGSRGGGRGSRGRGRGRSQKADEDIVHIS